VGANGPQLRRAADPAKDQSYFLFATTRDQLDFLRFPLGGMDKPTVRAVAFGLGLAIADKPDSQDICFVPEGKYTTVIDRLRPQGAEPGDIVHLDGRVLGRHEGVTRYTIGQRRGLNIAVGDPLFVVKIDADKRQVIVGPREALLTAALTLKEGNWLGGQDSLAAAARRRPARAGPRPLDPRTRRRPPGLQGDGQPRSCSTAPRKAWPPARPACSTIPPIPSACSAAASSPPFWKVVAPAVLKPDGGVLALAAHRAAFEQRYCTPRFTGGAPWICTWKCALRLWPRLSGFSNQMLRYQRMPEGWSASLACRPIAPCPTPMSPPTICATC
jgi:hypothetical protein